jgi:hypothetical protein
MGKLSALICAHDEEGRPADRAARQADLTRISLIGAKGQAAE